MRYQKISRFDIANGLGIGTVLWVSGCDWKCTGCHNPETWDSTSGELFTDDTLQELLDSLDNPHISRLTISGGDPMRVSSRDCVLNIVSKVKSKYPDKKVWLYTGYSFENIKYSPILEWVDVLVDGRFIIEQRDITLPFCGSTNQRVIDVPKTLESGSVVLFDN